MKLLGKSAEKIAKCSVLLNVACLNCRCRNTLELKTIICYNSIFFIPSFPQSKLNLIECKECHHVFHIENQSNEIQTLSKLQSQQTKIPLWYFSGALLLFIIVPFLLISAF